jgi:hypothetical protein
MVHAIRSSSAQARLQLTEELLPAPARGPAPQPAVDGLPGTVALRQVAPGDAGVEDEQDAVEDPAVIMIRPPMSPGRGQQRLQERPLPIGGLVATGG